MSKEGQTYPIEEIMAAWVDMSQEVWTAANETWDSLLGPGDMKTTNFDISKFMESFCLALAHPFLELENVSTDMCTRTGCEMFRSGLKGMLSLQEDWFKLWAHWGKESGNGHGKTGEFSQTAFSSWLEDSENVLNRFLQLPKLGPTRNLGEKFSSYWSAYQRLCLVWNEFLSIFGHPIESSFYNFQKKLEDLKEKDQIPEKTDEFYSLWISILEAECMELLQSDEYIRVMHRTLEAVEDFYGVQQDLGQDMLAYLPVASQQEVDELSKENHQLKKQLKVLTKKVAALEAKSEGL